MPGTINLKRPRHIIVKFIISGDPEQSPRAPREGKGPQTQEREGEWCSLPQEHYWTLEDSGVKCPELRWKRSFNLEFCIRWKYHGGRKKGIFRHTQSQNVYLPGTLGQKVTRRWDLTKWGSTPRKRETRDSGSSQGLSQVDDDRGSQGSRHATHVALPVGQS